MYSLLHAYTLSYSTYTHQVFTELIVDSNMFMNQYKIIFLLLNKCSRLVEASLHYLCFYSHWDPSCFL